MHILFILSTKNDIQFNLNKGLFKITDLVLYYTEIARSLPLKRKIFLKISFKTTEGAS